MVELSQIKKQGLTESINKGPLLDVDGQYKGNAETSYRIGNVNISGNVVVAPMAGISNKTFRMICKDFGASLVVGEMVSDKAIVFGNDKTFDLLKMDEKERPISQQIFGSDVESFVHAAKYIEENNVKFSEIH